MSKWQTKKLGEILDLIKGKKPKIFVSKSNKPYLTAKVIRKAETPKFAAENDPASVWVKKEDIVIIMDGSNSGEMFTGLDGALASTMGIVKYPEDLLNPKYLLHFLITHRENFTKSKTGAAIPHLNKEAFENLEISLPPLPEQKRIVKILDEVFGKTAKARENIEKNLQNSRELFESYLENIFANPGKDWEEKKLKNVGETQTGLTPRTSKKDYYGKFIPFIKPADIDIGGTGSLNYENEGLSKEGLEVGRKIKKSSVVMVCIGASIGKVGFSNKDISCNQQINTLSPKSDYESRFFYYALRTKSFFNKVIHNSSQATLPIINKSKWENLTVAFPKSYAGQNRIVKGLDSILELSKKLENVYTQKLDDLDELKKSVLNKAFAQTL